MLAGSMNYFKGAERLLELREKAGIYANDPDFIPFICVLSEIEYLRNEGCGYNWNLLEDPDLQLRVLESLSWAKTVSLANCESLAKRYPP